MAEASLEKQASGKCHWSLPTKENNGSGNAVRQRTITWAKVDLEISVAAWIPSENN